MTDFLSLAEIQARRNRTLATISGKPGNWVRFIAKARPEGAIGIFEDVPIIADVEGKAPHEWASVALAAYREAGWEPSHIIRIEKKEP